jgi:hypothetical protein
MRDKFRHAILVSKSGDGINRGPKPSTPPVAAPSHATESIASEMPTLFRFLLVIGLLGSLGYAGMFALSHYVDPHPREMTVIIPPDKLSRHR